MLSQAGVVNNLAQCIQQMFHRKVRRKWEQLSLLCLERRKISEPPKKGKADPLSVRTVNCDRLEKGISDVLLPKKIRMQHSCARTVPGNLPKNTVRRIGSAHDIVQKNRVVGFGRRTQKPV